MNLLNKQNTEKALRLKLDHMEAMRKCQNNKSKFKN